MVGLKAFWILLSTLMFVACVPQTKQTECASNEAFNASLRTCVPIVQGASSFINIKNFVPQFTQTRAKNDTSMLTFSIVVDNPYNQSHSVEWERVFNAAPTYICSNSYTCSFPASYLGTVLGEVGTHIITAKVKDGNGAVVASHSFELKVNELPRPVIIQPVVPLDLTFEVFPTDPRVEFSFNIKNNGAFITASQNYRTEWTILKNGTVVYSESDGFLDYSTNGTNRAYLGNPTSNPATPFFNPGSPIFGVGSYSIRASVKNSDPGEIVAEQYWNVDVKQPPLANITNVSSPEVGKKITAYNGLNYTEYPALNWIDDTSTKPEFCVTVDDRDGTYAADGKSILVKFYLNSQGGDICTVKTQDTPGSQRVCLVGAQCQTGAAPVGFNPAILKFHNPSSNIEQTHKVSARLFDEATGLEFERSNVMPSMGSYPIEWNVLVKPLNTAPQMSFGPALQNPAGCTATGAFSHSNCQVNQGQPFLVSFTVKDDFYDPAGDPENFQWNVDLKLNGANVSGTETSCSKAFNTDITIPAQSGPYEAAVAAGAGVLGKAANQWACQITVPHYIPTGPLSPNAGQFTVVATMQDDGSLVGGAGLISQSLTWKLVVTETNDSDPSSGIVIADQGNDFLDTTKSTVTIGATNVALNPAVATNSVFETDAVRFNIRATDKERDNLKFKISLCTNNTPSDCTATAAITSPTYVDFIRILQLNPTEAQPLLVYDYTIDEYLLQKITPAPNEDKNVANKVNFEVEVMDVPSILVTPVATQKKIISFFIKNHNPAPVVGAGAVPAVGSIIPVLSGYPVTIYPGSVTDDSAPGVEKVIKYQWYARVGAGAWDDIDGATFQTLRYTPGNITTNIELKLCVGDRPAANPLDPNTGSCSGIWTITPKKSIETMASPTNGAPVDMDFSENEIAVWHDDVNPSLTPDSYTYYSAYEGTNSSSEKMIYVDKIVKLKNGDISSKSTISFSPLEDGTPAGKIKDLSITGTNNNLYIAYLASFDTLPEGMMPRIRRIDISRPYGKEQFGFNYDHYDITTNCTPGACGGVLGDGKGSQAEITFNATLGVGDTIRINGSIFTASLTPAAADEICATGACTDVNSTATNVAQKINLSTDYRLQGISALASGPKVILYGQYHNDYVDFNGSIGNALIAKSLGKIFVDGTQWHLPMVNTLSAQSKITVVSGPALIHLQQGNPMTDINTTNTLNEMGEVASFDAGMNQLGELVFARISGNASDAGRMRIYRYYWTGLIWALSINTGSSSQAIFGSYDFDTVKFAPNAVGNNYYYVLARERSVAGGKWHIGRYHPNLNSTPIEQELSNRLLTTKDDETFGNTDLVASTLMKGPALVSVPNAPEARIFFSSVGSGTTAYPRLAQWMSNDMISCGSCESLTLEELGSDKIGVSQISSSLEFGSPGFLVTRDVFFTGFHLKEDPTDPARPYSGIINTRAEAIHSTTLNAGGLWRPPFVLDQ